MSYREFSFILPKGLIDSNDEIHRYGKMRSTTGKDEIIIQQDVQVQKFAEYGVLVTLSRVITELGQARSRVRRNCGTLITAAFKFSASLPPRPG